MHKKGRTLIEYDGNRQNNFTVIRILFAWLVLWGHSYPIQSIPGVRHPLNVVFQGSVWIGDIAVNGFFAISGFLVIASFLRRGVIVYTISRLLRILPALFVFVAVLVFIFGPIVTNLSITTYFTEPRTYKYLLNAFPVSINYVNTLPGVFETNAKPGVNGSLWTLPVEMRCYLLLALAGFFGLLKRRTVANVFLATIFLFGIYSFEKIPLIGIGNNFDWARPSLYFLLGVFFYINRTNILLDIKLAILASILIMFSFGKEWFPYIFPLAFIYLIFYIAYATKYFNADEMIGDISYGVYIYAWPVQQLFAQLFPNAHPVENTIFSSIIVFSLAYLSWHYVEKPSLRLRKKILGLKINRYIPDILGLITRRESNKV